MKLVSDSVTLDTVDPLDTVKEVLEFIEEVPDVDEVVDYPCCSTFHAGSVFGEACCQARRIAHRCARCGILHDDYDLLAQVLDKMENFDCEFYIPGVEKLEMRGEIIILLVQVVEKLEGKMEKMKQAKNSAQADKEDEANNKQ
jgi:hypothetical protein